MKTIPFSTGLLLCALTNSPCQSLDSPPDSALASQRGTPGVAIQQGVVNVAELTRQEDGEQPSPAAAPTARHGILAASPDTASPPLAASFRGLVDIGDDSNVPDTHGAVGPNHIVTSVNRRMRVQDRAGNILHTISYYDFWAPIASASEFCCDDRVLYDPYDDRWIVVGLTGGDTTRPSTLIAVSQGPDPLDRWNLYRIQGDRTGQLYPDYPRIGFNKDWIVVQASMNRVSDDFGVGIDIYALSKTNVYAGGVGAFTRFQLRGDYVAPHPVTTYDPSFSTFYLVSAPVGPARVGVEGATNLNQLKIFSITGAIGSEVLSERFTITTPYEWDGEPPGGLFVIRTNNQVLPQLGSPKKMSARVAVIVDAKFRNDSLWAVHEVWLPPGGSPTRVSVQWWQIGLDGTILQHGLIDDPTGVQFFSEPSIAANQFNDVLIGYSRFASNQYASANYSFRFGTDPPNTLRADTVLKAGEAPFTLTVDFAGARVRWGDYSHTTVDPLNDTDLWTIQEYAASPVGKVDRWGTWWGHIAPPPSPLPLLLLDAPTVTEGDFGTTNAVFNVRLTRIHDQPVTVAFATSDLTAQAGLDYAATNGILTFAPGELTKTIVVPVLGDLLVETNETFHVTLSQPINAVLGIPFAVGRIIDDDPAGLSISDVTVREGDIGATNALFTVTLSKPFHLPVSVDFGTADGTALAGSNYVATSGALTFEPDETSKTISVAVNGDELDEADKTFTVNLSKPMNAALAVVSQATGTIVDDDPLALEIADATVSEGDSGTTNLLFTVTLSKPYHLAVSVDFATADGTALAGSDYAATNGTLTFAPGETSKTISVAVNGDEVDESNEDLFVNLSNPVNVTRTDNQAKGTIFDDDPLVLSIRDIRIAEGQAVTNAALLNVTLSKPVSVPVSIDFATADGTAKAGSDYAAASGTLSIAPGQTNSAISIPIFSDLLDEPDESIVVNLTNPINVQLIDAQARVSILDDDTAAFAVSDALVETSNTGERSLNFIVSLSPAGSSARIARVSTADATAHAGIDYIGITNLLLTFPAGTTAHTVTVHVLDSTVPTVSKTLRLNLTSTVSSFNLLAQGVGTIEGSAVPAIRLSAALVNGQLRLTLTGGQPNESYGIETSVDLKTWGMLASTLNTDALGHAETSVQLNGAAAFYRVRKP